MSDPEFVALKADIEQHGLREPIVMYEGKVLDGRHRLKACFDLKLKLRERKFTGTEDDARAFVLSMNLRRRHLNAEQKRELIATLLKTEPERSNNSIAKPLGVSHNTVAAVRADLESSGDVVKLTTRTDDTGRVQPAKKQPTPTQIENAERARRHKAQGMPTVTIPDPKPPDVRPQSTAKLDQERVAQSVPAKLTHPLLVSCYSHCTTDEQVMQALDYGLDFRLSPEARAAYVRQRSAKQYRDESGG
jgi:hypothetical protein